MRRKTVITLLFIGLLLAISAHLVGYKIFGSPVLYENQPLDRPRKAAKINEMGEIILADGSRYHIYGIKTILSNPLEQIRYFQWQIPTFEIEIADPNKPVSKVWCKIRIMYWCGNTWFPRFLPGRLPKFSKEDLGMILVRQGGAIPTIEVFQEDLPYAKELVHSMERTAPVLEFQKNKEYASKLGRFLINEHPEFFNTGAWLLAHAGEPEIVDILRKRIVDNLMKRELEGSDIISPNEVEDLIPVLIKASPDDAKEVAHEIFGSYRNKFPYLKVALALKLMTVDDWYGLDTLMNEIIDPELDTSYRQGIVGRLENPLILCWQRGGGDYSETAEAYWARLARWYRDSKGKLVWNAERQEMTFRTDGDPSLYKTPTRRN
jgi:hypothetical protein